MSSGKSYRSGRRHGRRRTVHPVTLDEIGWLIRRCSEQPSAAGWVLLWDLGVWSPDEAEGGLVQVPPLPGYFKGGAVTMDDWLAYVFDIHRHELVLSEAIE